MGTVPICQQKGPHLAMESTVIQTLTAMVLCALATASIKAGDFVWPAKGQKAAVVLTYDDALLSQLEIAIPQLEAAGLRGTFFLDADISPDDMLRWREVASRGHELGNHSLFHPCPRTMLPDRKNYLTDNYDPARMVEEIAAMNNILFGIDGRRTRTFSVPCSQTIVGGQDYTDSLRRSGQVRFVRTGGDQWTSVITDFTKLDLFRIPSYGPVDGPTGAQLVAYLERVRAAGGLGVLQFHGVGGDYLQVSAPAHQAVVDYLSAHPEIWVGTFQEVVDYVSARTR
jgi:peptidoglycan-N-acetylglucosamine deacetylase